MPVAHFFTHTLLIFSFFFHFTWGLGVRIFLFTIFLFNFIVFFSEVARGVEAGKLFLTFFNIFLSFKRSLNFDIVTDSKTEL